MTPENFHFGPDRSSQGWSTRLLSPDPNGILSDSEALFKLTHNAAKVIEFTRRHPRLTTLGLMGTIYGVGLATDYFDSVNLVHAQDVQAGDLNCRQIDNVVTATGEKVVHPYTNGDVDPSRMLQCVGLNGPETRVPDCEAVIPGYAQLHPDGPFLCVDNNGALQPTTSIESLRQALRDMFSQPAPVETAGVTGSQDGGMPVSGQPTNENPNAFLNDISPNWKIAGGTAGVVGLGVGILQFRNWLFAKLRTQAKSDLEKREQRKYGGNR